MSKKKTYHVKTPNPHFKGIRNGVVFENGQGQASEADARNLVTVWGYACEELEVKSEKQEGETANVKRETADEPTSQTAKTDIQGYMSAHDIAFEPSDTKAELLEKIDAWAEAQE